MSQDSEPDKSVKNGDNTETLLKAIDAEITGLTARIAATGRNRWGLMLTLAGLAWAALQCWENNAYNFSEVVPLTLGLYLAWDFILKATDSLDKPLASASRRTGGFFDISQYLGAARSTIVLDVLLEGAAAWISWSQHTLPYKLLFGYTLALSALSTLAFITSFFRLEFSKVGLEETGNPNAVLVNGVIWILRIIAVACSLHLFWKNPAILNAPNLRFALILAAIPYVLTLLAKDEFLLHILAALRSIRQSLAFGRMKAKDAQTELTLILAGEQLAQALQRPFDQLTDAMAKARSSIYHLKDTLDKYAKNATEVNDQTSQELTPESASALLAAGEAAQKDFRNLKNYASNLKTHYVLLKFLAPNSSREAKPLFDKIRPAIEALQKDLAVEKKRLKALKITKHSTPWLGPSLIYNQAE